MLHAIYFTDPWDCRMGWTVRYSCVSERDRWTSRGMSHDPMGPWDGMDSRTHASVEEQVDILWNVPWGCGMGWTIPCNPMIPWDCGLVVSHSPVLYCVTPGSVSLASSLVCYLVVSHSPVLYCVTPSSVSLASSLVCYPW